MTLDEAIQHAEETASKCSNNLCAEDHRQLAKWLKQLKNFIEGENNNKNN